MNFCNMKLVYLVICVGLGLIILLPTLVSVVALPSGEKFSELWMLGQNGMAGDYPSNVKENAVYLVYLGVGNHIGSSAYYVLDVKMRSQNEPLPNFTTGLASPLPTLYEYRLFVAENASAEVPLTFQVSRVTFFGDRAFVGDLVVNGVSFAVDKTISWDSEKSGYYFQLFMELWIYDFGSDGFSYTNRFVNRWLNVTRSLQNV